MRNGFPHTRAHTHLSERGVGREEHSGSEHGRHRHVEREANDKVSEEVSGDGGEVTHPVGGAARRQRRQSEQ